MNRKRVDTLTNCVSCGKPIELSPAGYMDHHCSSVHEGAKRAANTRLHDPVDRDMPFWQRLSEGFEMMEQMG